MRRAIEALRAEPDAAFILQVKEQQFMDAINTALGIDFEAIASLGPVVPGQRIVVRAALTNRGTPDIEPAEIALVAGNGWRIQPGATIPSRLAFNQTARQTFAVTVQEDALLTRPYFAGFSCALCGFCVERCDPMYRPAAEPALAARARYTVAGATVEIRSTVRRREPHLPYGDGCAS